MKDLKNCDSKRYRILQQLDIVELDLYIITTNFDLLVPPEQVRVNRQVVSLNKQKLNLKNKLKEI